MFNKIILGLMLTCAGVFAQSITVTNSIGAKLAWDDPNAAGTIKSYLATMTSPMGTFRSLAATNFVALTNFTGTFANGNYTFSVAAIGTNGLSSDASTNLSAFILVPPLVVVDIRLVP